MNKQQLASKIWESANKMRSKIEANEYKDYILGFIFYKFLSETEVARLKARDWIIGGKSRIDPALNSPAQLAAGIGTVDYDVTFAAPLENLILNQRITDKYYSGFADQLNN